MKVRITSRSGDAARMAELTTTDTPPNRPDVEAILARATTDTATTPDAPDWYAPVWGTSADLCRYILHLEASLRRVDPTIAAELQGRDPRLPGGQGHDARNSHDRPDHETGARPMSDTPPTPPTPPTRPDIEGENMKVRADDAGRCARYILHLEAVVHERLAAAGTAFIRFAQHRSTCACITTEGACDCGLAEALDLFTITKSSDD